MKISYNNLLTLFILMFILVMNFSCNDCELTAEFLLTEKQKENNPYFGGEEIIYLSNKTPIEFNCTGRTNEEYEVVNSKYSCDYSVYERDITKIENNNYQFTYFMAGRTTYGFYFLDRVFNFSMYSKFKLDQLTGEISDYYELIDTLMIDDTKYINIYMGVFNYVSNDSISIDTLNHAAYLYYSSDFGIIKVDFSDGSTWELQDIIW